MGFFGDVAKSIRTTFSRDKTRAAVEVAKGTLHPVMPGGMLTTYGGDTVNDYLRLDYDLLARYAEYEAMDEIGEISTVLDIVADDATVFDQQRGRTVWVTSKDRSLEIVLDDLFHRILRIDEEIWAIARTMCLFGNDYEELLVTEDGVRGLTHLPSSTVRRVEGRHGNLYGFVQDFSGKIHFTPEEWKLLLDSRDSSGIVEDPSGQAAMPVTAFEDWEVSHFRLRGKNRHSVYGMSYLEPARWIWKRLNLMEDSALLFRIERAPERFAYYINTGDMPPAEGLAYTNKMRQGLKKQKFVDSSTGKLSEKYNVLTSLDDIFIPFRNGQEPSRVEVLQSPQWQCLVGGTKIPLLDGTEPTIKELAERKEPFWVYSVDESGRIVPGEGRNARITQESAEIWEVTLDNGEVVRCTGNHPFLTRDGKWVLAAHLRANDSLMPLYRDASKVSKSIKLPGYERVYDPASDKWVYTHQRVFEETTGTELKPFFESGNVIHHVNYNKKNNSPINLKGMSRSAHAELHTRIGATTENLKQTPERRAKNRIRMIERMSDKLIRAEKSKILIQYNQSEAHRNRVSGSNSDRWNDIDLAGIEYLVLSTGARTIHELMERGHVAQSVIKRVLASENITWNEFAAKNVPGWKPKGRALKGHSKNITIELLQAKAQEFGGTGIKEFSKRCGISANVISATLKDAGTSWKEFAPKYLSGWVGVGPKGTRTPVAAPAVPYNHKVVSVINTSTFEPVYCLTVEKYANFAIAHGVIVSNSTEDLEYFRDKLFAALKVPKSYLGQEAGVAKGSLSSQDVRFCRTTLRVQRELKNGLAKIARVHLAALNIDPFDTEYEIHMAVPSAIFELAQLEVLNARADLAARMGNFVSLHWILNKVFGLSDDEISVIIKARDDEAMHNAMVDAKAQAAAAKANPPPAPPGMPGAPGAPGTPPPGAPPTAPPAGAAPASKANDAPTGLLVPPGFESEEAQAQPATPQQQQEWIRNYGKALQEEASKRIRNKGLIRRGSGGISEEEIFRGRNKETEKRMEESLTRVLKHDKLLSHRLNELGMLLHEMKTIKGRG